MVHPPVKVTGTDGSETTYDNRGNLILEQYGKNKKLETAGEYIFDETNKMVKGVNGSAEESIYTYNGLGALMENTWIIAKNGYGYHDVTDEVTEPEDPTPELPDPGETTDPEEPGETTDPETPDPGETTEPEEPDTGVNNNGNGNGNDGSHSGWYKDSSAPAEGKITESGRGPADEGTLEASLILAATGSDVKKRSSGQIYGPSFPTCIRFTLRMAPVFFQRGLFSSTVHLRLFASSCFILTGLFAIALLATML